MQAHADADFPDPSTCPSCGRPVGPRRVCPYCEADCPEPRRIIIAKILAVVGATAGLLLAARSALTASPTP